MSDIELVIKINEEDYEIMKHNIAVNNPLCPLSEKEMVAKIANGTPLPKGHGDLIDISDIKPMRYTVNGGDYFDDYETIDWEDIEKVPTIIKADKEDEGE